MKTFNLGILKIVTILHVIQVVVFLIVAGILSGSLLYFKPYTTLHLIFTGMGVALLLSLKDIFGYIKKHIISRSKYPLPLNLLCNIIQLGKPLYFGKDTFSLDEIINDNKLSLTLYYINNPQYPILQFNGDKLLFHSREYNWNDLNWRYFLYRTSPYAKTGTFLMEFEGTDQDNNRIKNKIEFEKIKAQENEVILLFIIHDLLFGKRSSYYY
ncbi:hypothetical protein [Chryseobacterium sp.]|uniref:hypothetical protein n=1 Tax=Chryseobacterium sp. TaxID=1871047 RepID=UPI0025C3F2E5|nr:hypothetical protein [Chryseobacterium sp.]MBV8324664.1 hypothetical protein [Chryseobacterium sp.]